MKLNRASLLLHQAFFTKTAHGECVKSMGARSYFNMDNTNGVYAGKCISSCILSIITGMLALTLAFSGCSFWEEYVPADDDGDGDSTSDTTYQPSQSMVLVKAKDSSFQMGSNKVDGAKSVHIARFTYDLLMDTTEVTQGRYDSVMKARYPTAYTIGSWSDQYGKGSNFPVHSRTWYDAALYCNALSKREKIDSIYIYDSLAGKIGNGCELRIKSIDIQKAGYRLPTEAEWEYACRGGTTAEYYWGTDSAQDFAWYSTNAGGKSHSVAQRNPNQFGLYDMSGNVAEWCIDWFDGEYPDSSMVDPVILTLIMQPGAKHRIVRGGSFSDGTEGIRSAVRLYRSPSHFDQYIGFRTVRRKS